MDMQLKTWINLLLDLYIILLSVSYGVQKWPGEDCNFDDADVRVSCERMRKVEEYLLGGLTHLEESLVMISVNTYEGLSDIISVPSCHARESFNFFEFYILGLRFRVFLNFHYSDLKLKVIDDHLNVMIMAADHGSEPFIKEVADFFFKNDIK